MGLLARAAWRGLVEPRDRRPIPEWAHDFIRLSPPITRTGPFDVSGSRHFIQIFDSLQNDRKREVNVLKPVRGGGSLIGDVFCPWAMKNDPGPYMEVFQTESVASAHAEERSKRIFERCEPLKELLPSNRHKVRDDEILFSHGHTWYVRGPSLANLQAKGIRYLRLEEVWMWDQGRMAEAEGRIGDYLKMQTSKILRVSQGGPRDGIKMEDSDWFQAYYRGKIHEWEVQCPSCLKYFDPIFSGTRQDGSFWGMTWDRHMTASGEWDIAKCLPTIRFECQHCAHPMMDCSRTKTEWNRTGRYRQCATAGQGATRGDDVPSSDTGKRDSFHFECVIDFPWDELVELWLSACNAEKRGELKAKVQFYQKRRAMFRDEESLLKGGLNLRKVVYEINSAWPEERARFLTVDRQEEDLFWWSVRAWSNQRSRRLGFGRCYGFGAVEKLREQFKVAPNHTFIDSAYQAKGDAGVYLACLKHGWIAVKGAAEYHFQHRLKNKRMVLKSYAPLAFGDPAVATLGRKFCPLIRFSKPQMNQKVQELIDSGRWEEPMDSADPEMDKEYSLQMASRVKKTEFNAKTGQSKQYWKESKNDHARDLANAQVLGAMLSDLIPDPAAEVLARSETTDHGPQTTQTGTE